MLYGEEPVIDIPAVGMERVAIEDVLATRLGIKGRDAIALIESKMVGPYASGADREADFQRVARRLLDEANKPATEKVMMAGLPWIAGLLMVSMVMFKPKRRR